MEDTIEERIAEVIQKKELFAEFIDAVSIKAGRKGLTTEGYLEILGIGNLQERLQRHGA